MYARIGGEWRQLLEKIQMNVVNNMLSGKELVLPERKRMRYYYGRRCGLMCSVNISSLLFIFYYFLFIYLFPC